MNILNFYKKKQKGKKITCITCYDYSSAALLAETEVDCLLVGDSVAMTVHGFPTTLSATIEMMALHTSAVYRGAKEKFIIADLPFMSYRKSLSENISAAEALMRAGAHAVKLEGAKGNLEFIQHLVDSGIPVMGHLGLTPQSFFAMGGYKVQGKTAEAAQQILDDAIALQEAGCFSLVLECVPAAVALDITTKLPIATIGIGAGADTDGQVLVWQDLLGLNPNFQAKFVKKFVDGQQTFKTAINAYINEVQLGEFPGDEHSF